MPYDPLKPPAPPQFGTPGGMPIRRTEITPPRPVAPEQAFETPEFQMPDLVSVRYGAGDKQIVGSLLKAANGEESGLTGVPASYATKLLQSWGYPTTMDAWTADQWDAAIKANAAMTNPMAALMGY